MRAIRATTWPGYGLAVLAILVSGPLQAQEPIRWVDGGQEMILWPARHGPFLFVADYPLDNVQALAAPLEAIHKRLARELALPAAPELTRIYLFRDGERYQRFVRHYLPTLKRVDVSGRHGLFLSRDNIPHVFIRVTAGLERSLRHEYTHVLLHHQVPHLPIWLDEGLATYLEDPGTNLSPPHVTAFAGPTRRPADLARLERLKTMQQMSAADYAHARAWVEHLLEREPQGREILLDYLADLRQDPLCAPLSRRLLPR